MKPEQSKIMEVSKTLKDICEIVEGVYYVYFYFN